MPAWFDIRGERGPQVTFEALTAQSQDEAGLLRSRDYFLSIVRGEVEGHPITSTPSTSSPSSSSAAATPIPASQVLIGGFSQGGVLSLLSGLAAGREPGLGGLFCLSGYLPLADAVRAGDKKVFPGGGKGSGSSGMEVMMVHGDRDPIMNLEWAEKSAAAVKALGYDVDFRTVRYVFSSLFFAAFLSPVLHISLTHSLAHTCYDVNPTECWLT